MSTFTESTNAELLESLWRSIYHVENGEGCSLSLRELYTLRSLVEGKIRATQTDGSEEC